MTAHAEREKESRRIIGVVYKDRYAVEETFQLLKIPWEWYDPTKRYDVVIARGEDVPEQAGELINLDEEDVFKKASDLLNQGMAHTREPLCEIYMDRLRTRLREVTQLVEIPPIPWGYSYTVALTHDVDFSSVRERRWLSVGYSIYCCLLQKKAADGLRILLAKLRVVRDPWKLFEQWMVLERELGVKSSFYFLPFKHVAGINGPMLRAGRYDLDERLLSSLSSAGWEVGVHGIDNWKEVATGKEELARLNRWTGGITGTRVHWLFFDDETWKRLDEAGYYYDTSFGYNDDVGFRAGTLQAYKPRGVEQLVELPLIIQDGSLFRKRYLKLPEDQARRICGDIFGYAKRYGGVVTMLWHQTSLTEPHNWGGFYRYLVQKAQNDGAWVTRARDAVEWFKMRRGVRFSYIRKGDKLTIWMKGLELHEGIPEMRLRIHVEPEKVKGIKGEYRAEEGYVDVRCEQERVEVIL